ncbi:MAG TPA: hypothetical protein VG711_05035 [Phycisphaerales bacterium]|nr:hypothetical protein [Phycisphaerales bacterium]
MRHLALHIFRTFTLLCALPLYSFAQSSQPAPQSPPAALAPGLLPSDPANYTWLHPKGQTSRRGTTIPLPISKSELQAFKLLLNLSEEQFTQMTRIHQTYMDANFDLRKVDEAELIDLASRGMENYRSQESADAGVAMLHAQDRLLRKLALLDAQFFDQLAPLLTESQLADLPRAQSYRKRIIASEWHCQHTAGKPDLEVMIFDLLQQSPNPAADFATVSDLLRRYETRATPLWERYTRVMDEARLRSIQTLPYTSGVASSSSLTPAQWAAIDKQRLDDNKDLLSIGINRHKLNTEFLPQLVSALPESLGNSLRTTFNEQAYPPVYPNPFDCTDQLAVLEKLEPPLSAETRFATDSIVEKYRADLALIDRDMIRRYLDFWEDYLTERSFDTSKQNVYKADMDILQKRRRDLSDRTLKSVASILAGTQLDTFNNYIQPWYASADRHHPQNHGIYYVP